MKKLLTMLLCAAILVCCCACRKTEALPPAEEEGRLTLNALRQAISKEEIAALIGVADIADMEQMLLYLKSFYYHLPSEGDQSEPVTAWSVSDSGYNSLTLAQAKTLITPHILTTENWKEFIAPCTRTIFVNYSDESDTVIGDYEEESDICIKDGYHCSWQDLSLTLLDSNTGNELEFTGSDWVYPVCCEDGVYYTLCYDDEGNEIKTEFNIDDYTCTLAYGAVYEYNLDPALCYVEDTDEDSFELKFVSATAEDWENPDQNISAVIQYGDTNSDIAYVGYSRIGGYVYTNDDVDLFPDGAEAAPITPAPAAPLTLEVLQQLKTREELAAVLGVSDAARLRQMLIYLKNFYDHAHSENEPAEQSVEWGTTEEGYRYLTLAQAKALVTPYVLTADNWTDYIKPHMEEYECIIVDESGSETRETEEEPDISVLPEYQFLWDTTRLIIKNNKTGKIMAFNGSDWPESVSESDGRFSVTPINENGFGVSEEFNPDNYTCLLADGVVYSYTLPPELIYVEQYDDAAEDWVCVPLEDYEGEEDLYPFVLVQFGESEDDLYHIGENALGESIFGQW